MDCDGQDDPAEIKNFLHFLKNNSNEIVMGLRQDRKDSLFKRLSSRGFYFF